MTHIDDKIHRTDFEKMAGIKEDALVKLGPCAVCRKPLLDRETGSLTFYRLRIDRCAWDGPAVQQRAGLQMMLGGAGALARVMGPDRDLAKVFSGPHEVVVHEACAGEVYHLVRLIPDAEEEAESATQTPEIA